MSRIFIETKKGDKVGYQELDAPPPGKSYIIVPIATELVEKTGRLEADGHFHVELSELLARTIEQFFRSRPINIITPGPRQTAGLRLHDPRDPLKEQIN